MSKRKPNLDFYDEDDMMSRLILKAVIFVIILFSLLFCFSAIVLLLHFL